MPAMASDSELALEPTIATACASSTAFKAAWRPSTKYDPVRYSSRERRRPCTPPAALMSATAIRAP
jgi:hypothetical protein